MTLHELKRRVDKFHIRQEIVDVIIETKEEISELNRGQLFIGVRADGKEINPQYTDFTVMIKEEKGQPFDRVTLKDTGDFWASIEVDVKSESFDINATDSKAEKLMKKYGKQILGLSRDSKEEYRDNYFFPALKDRIQKKLGLKFT